jgi:hypothetical protein
VDARVALVFGSEERRDNAAERRPEKRIAASPPFSGVSEGFIRAGVSGLELWFN